MEKINIFTKFLIALRFLWNISIPLALSIYLTFYNMIRDLPSYIFKIIFLCLTTMGIFCIFITIKYLKDTDKGFFQLGYTISNIVLLFFFVFNFLYIMRV